MKHYDYVSSSHIHLMSAGYNTTGGTTLDIAKSVPIVLLAKHRYSTTTPMDSCILCVPHFQLWAKKNYIVNIVFVSKLDAHFLQVVLGHRQITQRRNHTLAQDSNHYIDSSSAIVTRMRTHELAYHTSTHFQTHQQKPPWRLGVCSTSSPIFFFSWKF